MTTNNDVKWYERLIKVERKADGAYDHALSLHEKLGEVFRGVASLKAEVRSCSAEVQTLRKEIRVTRSEMGSVPDLMATVAKEEITKNHDISELRRFRKIKGFLKSSAGKAITEGLKYLAIAGAMYLLHKVGVLGK